MSSKRAFLKQAKEALASKDYHAALTHCKAVLQEDKACYDAYVLIGKAAFFLKEYTQAEAAYKRASDLDAANLMAWQGFAELYSETGQWAAAASAYANLVQLTSASPDEAIRARAQQFLRKQSESAFRAGSYSEAEDCYRRLLVDAPDGPSRLELLCLLADVQLGFDRLEVERRLAARMAEATIAGEAISEAVLRQAVEAEWAEEGLEMEMDHASATLREILAEAPPSPRYAPYYEAYLRRLRKYLNSAPAGSMERHNRRIALVQFSKFMMEGRVGDQIGGCCSSLPYEAALSMLEVEGEVAAPPQTAQQAQGLGPEDDTAAASSPTSPEPLVFADSECICKRLAHAFPWSPAAGVHLALAMRRRWLHGRPSQEPCTGAPAGATVAVTVLSALHGKQQRLSAHRAAATQRKFVLRELLAGLKRGVNSAAGWLAAADLLLEHHQELQRQQLMDGAPASAAHAAAQGALDAAKEGLKFVAHRDFLGKEHMEQAGLLLRLTAARALLALGVHAEAEGILSSLAERCSEGRAAFALLAGMPPVNVSQQAVRSLAQSALAQGDRSAARRLYESLVGRLALGRDSCGATAEPWAHAEYGWLMMEEGDLGVAQQQLETAVHLAEQQQQHKAGGAHPMTDAAELGTMRVKLARVYWALGGELRAARGSGAHAALLAAAAADGPHQAAAFSWLGRWYHEVAADEPRARKCYQRALALDPAASEHAGRGLVALLVAGGQDTVATELCAETVAACPAAHWALRSLARLQLAAAQAKGQAQGHAAAHAQAAVLTYQRAVRASPAVGELWEGLAAGYQALGRHTAALKAFTRALELEPARLFSLLQCGAIHHQLGSLTQAADCFRRALELSPGHPAALLGSAEARLASAQLHWRMGAGGVAAMELHAAALSAAECGARHGNMAAAWKLAGDALLQHAGVSPLEQVRRVGAAKPGEPAAAAAAEAVTARAAAVRAARTAYCKALHLDPTQGLVWGDAAVAAYQEASLTSLASSSSSPPISSSSSASPRPRLLALAQRLVQGGLKLEPSSEWLWACAGSVAEGSAASREYCWTRALQVNPKRAATWAALGRLYALKGAGALAQQCFEHARSHEPTLVSVWEAMASLAATRSKVPGDPAYADMMDAYEHAVGLGGGLESRLAFAADSIKSGAGPTGEVFAASTKCVQQLPTLAAAHNSLGLAAEARGHLAEAVAAFETALALMPAAAAATPSEGNSDDAAFQLVYLGVGPCGADLGLQAATGPRSLHMALRLNLCRTLAKVAGSGDERATDAARAAVALYRELVAEGALQSDALAWVSYASALERAGGSDAPAQVASALEAAVAVASSSGDGGDGGKAPAVAAMVAARRLVCALALCKHLVQQGKWQEAHRLVQEQTAKSAMDADCAALAAQLWLALWAAVTAANTAATSTAAPAIPAPPPGLKLSIPAQLQAWALSQKAVDMAKVSAHVCSIDATGAAASGNLAAATHAAARAVRCCPWDPRFRLQLASCASSASPEKAMAASRAAPLAPARLVAPAIYCLAVVPASEPAPMSGAMSAAPSAPRPPVAPAPVAAAAVAPPTNPSLAHCDLGGAHVLRASGLLSTLPLPQLQHALASEVSRLTHLVHAQPDSTVAWYLLALVSLQHAAAVRGAQCRLYRQTLARCRVALGKVQALHAQLKPPPAPAAAGAAGPVGGLAAMINAAAAAAAAKQREKAALPSKEKALQHLAASLALRLLAASSECHLHVRLPGCQQRAKDTAAEALRWALQHELSPALAHRQLGRVQRALGELEAAQVALNQAAMAKDVPALLEYSSLLSSCGKEREALQLLASAQGLGGLPDGHPASCMALAAALEPVKLRAELGDLAGARQELGERVRQDNGQQQDGMVPAGAMAAALAQQARVALGQAQAEATSVQQGQQQGEGQAAGDAAVKRLVLEARWAAGAAIKELQGQTGSLGGGGEEALARLLLGQAELARSRPDKAIDELEQAIALWARPVPAALVAQHQLVKARQSGGPAQVPRACLAGAVHAQPWSAESWQRLLAAR